jgi:hypothetical protein
VSVSFSLGGKAKGSQTQTIILANDVRTGWADTIIEDNNRNTRNGNPGGSPFVSAIHQADKSGSVRHMAFGNTLFFLAGKARL